MSRQIITSFIHLLIAVLLCGFLMPGPFLFLIFTFGPGMKPHNTASYASRWTNGEKVINRPDKPGRAMGS